MFLSQLSIRTRLLVFFMLFNILSVVLYTTISINNSHNKLIEHINQRLHSSALIHLDLLGEDFINQAFNNQKVSKEAFEKILKQTYDQAQTLGVTYLYTMKIENNKVYLMSDGATPENISAGDYVPYLGEYEEASPKILEAYHSKTTIFDEYSDRYGQFRAVYIPKTTASGHTYLVGADIETSMINQELQKELLFFIALGLGFTVFVVMMALIASKNLTAPIKNMSHTFQSMAQAHDLTHTISTREPSKDEVSIMAHSMHKLIQAIRETFTNTHTVSSDNAHIADNFIQVSKDLNQEMQTSKQQMNDISQATEHIRINATNSSQLAQDIEHRMLESTNQLNHIQSKLDAMITGISQSSHESAEIVGKLQQLEQETDKIRTILDSIAQISEQTNLLALNPSKPRAQAKLGEDLPSLPMKYENSLNKLKTRSTKLKPPSKASLAPFTTLPLASTSWQKIP